MISRTKNTFLSIVELLKWGVVVWLLWPLLSFQTDKMTLWRMVLGVLLTVLFLGKMFYDFIIDNFKQRKERYTFTDFLLLAGFIAGIAVLIGGGILVIGLYISGQIRESTLP